MSKLFLIAGIVSLLTACANMSGTTMSRSSGPSDTSAMGAPGNFMGGNGPAGSSGGGPN